MMATQRIEIRCGKMLCLLLLLIFSCTPGVIKVSSSSSSSSFASSSLPTLYEHYTAGGIRDGLQARPDRPLTLNGKPFVIYAGSLHYFRVVPQYWRQMLARFKAAGLNTVQTYVPWNLHEDTPGRYDFDSLPLNLSQFLDEIKQANMFAIVRLGPYICAEWDFGGFPSWLLRNRDDVEALRTANPRFLRHVFAYWRRLLPIVVEHQFRRGGPVIAAQIENEYFSAPIKHDLAYIEALRRFTRENNFNELLFTSDPVEVAATIPIRNISSDLLETANLNRDAFTQLSAMKVAQSSKPIYVSEFWPGWFDSWRDKAHHRYGMDDFDQQTNDILFRVNGSLNFYMFVGGTNFGFMNGARVVTSYDYDAPLTESGNYTDKYFETRAIYDRLVASGRLPPISLPDDPPPVQPTADYGTVAVSDWLPLENLLDLAWRFEHVRKLVSMELLDHGPGYGQRYGFVLYRTRSKPIQSFEITGPIADRAIFLIDGNETSVIEDGSKNFSIKIDWRQRANSVNAAEHHHRYDVLVENQGRANWGVLRDQRKGIESTIKLDGVVWRDHTIYSLDWNRTFVQAIDRLDAWIPFDARLRYSGPAAYRTTLAVDSPVDTFLELPGWSKGCVFVNGHNLGRYWSVGPQRTLYIPASFLRAGKNVIHIFELHRPGAPIRFIDGPILESSKKKQK